ncbi:MAG: DegT/DnrJ/EryC1/StrS aminotransferase family protein [Planctomycetota bacterium]|nr:DegT/DnrJ/EryC1/StrS aminotransferase family protein [Planctomycetota bacterium]
MASAQPPYIVFGSPYIGQEEVDAVIATMRSGWMGTGPRTNEFETKFAKYVGAKYAVAVNSCTAALHVSMLASGVGAGDEVITTPLTFAATANVIVHAGATPVFADINRETQSIDPAEIRRKITKKTKAIIAVHLLGRPVDLDAIHAIAREHNLLVIEDAAHAIETSYHGKKVGSISPLTCFSFYVTKNMTSVEGGMITTNDEKLAGLMRTYSLHGLSRDAWSRFSDKGYKHYEVVLPGFKYNMTDLQASIGLCQLERVPGWLKVRDVLWERYNKAFADLPVFAPAKDEPNTVHARHLYTPLLDIDNMTIGRDEVMGELHKRGIGSGVHYRALHLHEYYRKTWGYEPDDFPNARWVSDRTLSLPFSAKLSEEEIVRIIDTFRDVVGGARRKGSAGKPATTAARS